MGRQLVTLPAAGGLADAADAALGAVGDVLVLVQVTRVGGNYTHSQSHSPPWPGHSIPYVCSWCTGVPVHTRRIFLPGVAWVATLHTIAWFGTPRRHITCDARVVLYNMIMSRRAPGHKGGVDGGVRRRGWGGWRER